MSFLRSKCRECEDLIDDALSRPERKKWVMVWIKRFCNVIEIRSVRERSVSPDECVSPKSNVEIRSRSSFRWLVGVKKASKASSEEQR